MTQVRPFADVSRSQQRRRLRRSADEAIARYGIDDAQLKLIQLDFNATYRVDRPNGQRFALRINVNSARDRKAVATEAAWVQALERDTELTVPSPQPTIDGEYAFDVTCEGVDRPIPATMYSWLDGPNLGENASFRTLEELGRCAALLHDHARFWKRPKNVAFGSIDHWMLDEPDNFADLKAPWFTKVRKVIFEARDHIDATVAPIFTTGKALPIHADLHMWNTKRVDGGVAVFDFDDAGMGRELQDLAISSFYLRDRPGGEEALLRGYSAVRPVPQHTVEQWEALIAGRSILMLNAVVALVTAGYADFAPTYAERTAKRMRHYLKTGRFELDV